MEPITFKSELDFITNYNKIKNKVLISLLEDLPMRKKPGTFLKKKKGFKHLMFINSKYLGNWAVHDNKEQSNSLIALAGKITHMVNDIGCPNSVLPMLQKIATGRIKHFSKKESRKSKYKQGADPLGRGHFRWNYKVYTLTKEELTHLNAFLKKSEITNFKIPASQPKR